MNYKNIITIEPGKRSGKPCIRGMRITVYDIFFFIIQSLSIVYDNFFIQSLSIVYDDFFIQSLSIVYGISMLFDLH